MKKDNRVYRGDAMRSAHEAAAGLLKVGAIDRKTMRRFDAACLTTIDDLDADAIREIRQAAQMSQAVFAQVLNVSKSIVSKWEQGDKKPSGPSLKLLSIAHQKGVEAIL